MAIVIQDGTSLSEIIEEMKENVAKAVLEDRLDYAVNDNPPRIHTFHVIAESKEGAEQIMDALEKVDIPQDDKGRGIAEFVITVKDF